jgi:hypothetical protein
MNLQILYNWFLNKKFYNIIFFLIISLSLLSSCGGFSKVDTRKTPIKGRDRAKQNVQEGKGVTIMGAMRGGKTSYEFSTSNPMWRASLDILDFIPLATVDYSGGLIISDWYNDSSNSKESLKITVRFLSNDIKSNSLKIVVHKKTCITVGECKVNLLKSKISEELAKSILTKAVEIKRQTKEKK